MHGRLVNVMIMTRWLRHGLLMASAWPPIPVLPLRHIAQSMTQLGSRTNYACLPIACHLWHWGDLLDLAGYKHVQDQRKLRCNLGGICTQAMSAIGITLDAVQQCTAAVYHAQQHAPQDPDPCMQSKHILNSSVLSTSGRLLQAHGPCQCQWMPPPKAALPCCTYDAKLWMQPGQQHCQALFHN